MRDDLQAGGRFPDMELTDHTGTVRALGDLAEGDPVLLQFYRGWFCPKERTFFSRLVAFQSEVEVAYSRIVSVSVEPPEVQAAFRAGLGARWTFLSDSDRVHLDDLGLRETSDSYHQPYLPTVFALFPDLRIHRVYHGYWYWGRPTLEQLRGDLREISQAIRPDWSP